MAVMVCFYGLRYGIGNGTLFVKELLLPKNSSIRQSHPWLYLDCRKVFWWVRPSSVVVADVARSTPSVSPEVMLV